MNRVFKSSPGPVPDPEDEKGKLRRIALAGKLARDTQLQQECRRFVKAVMAAASSPEVGKLAAGTLLDFELAKVED